MTPVKRFTLRASAFAALQLGVLAALLATRPEAEAPSYFAATIDKHARLDATPPPRLILVGGSSVAFGHDSPAIAAPLGLSPVNMGLQANLPTSFMLAEVEDALGKGDVVLLALEYERLMNAGGWSPELDEVLRARPASQRYWEDAENPLDRGFEELRFALRRRLVELEAPPVRGAPYDRESFDAVGDLVAHRTLHRAPLDVARIPAVGPYSRAACSEVLGLLNRFDERARARGARVFVVPPPLPVSLFERSAPTLEQLTAQLERELTTPLLLAPRDAAQPTEQFFDTAYHLNAEGVEARTRLLTRALVARLR